MRSRALFLGTLLGLLSVSGCTELIPVVRNHELRGYYMGVKETVHCWVTRIRHSDEKGLLYVELAIMNGAPRKLEVDSRKFRITHARGGFDYMQGAVVELPYNKVKNFELLLPISGGLEGVKLDVTGFVADKGPVPDFRIEFDTEEY